MLSDQIAKSFKAGRKKEGVKVQFKLLANAKRAAN
jgi:hypothetical protein